jgi:site-specific recombinase XerD
MHLDTGIRASELLDLDFENVNPITGVVQILHGKGGKFRTAYLSKKSRIAQRKHITKKTVKKGSLFTS